MEIPNEFRKSCKKNARGFVVRDMNTVQRIAKKFNLYVIPSKQR